MRVLLVEPNYRRGTPGSEHALPDIDGGSAAVHSRLPDDETLWYPPLGLMKLARFHKNRGDQVHFVRGCDRSAIDGGTLFSLWDRVYITTLFTFHFDDIVKAIKFYRDAVGGTSGKIFVGGIMASLMPDAIFERTGVYPLTGLLDYPNSIGLDGDEGIDSLAPDYDILDHRLYAINDTYYAYTTRGCVNKCPWCGVPKIEPEFKSYIDIKPVIRELRSRLGDKARLKLMDNNVLASPELDRIVDDLLELGYGKGQCTETQPKKQRVIDFNQGIDAFFLREKEAQSLFRLNIKPLRIAFDRPHQKKEYVKAVKLARRYGADEVRSELGASILRREMPRFAEFSSLAINQFQARAVA